MNRHALASFLCLFALAVSLACSGCSVTRHQKPGRSSQLMPASIGLPADYPAGWGMQEMTQPENPIGESRQNAERTTTTVDPKTGVVTVTTDKAETVIGGSQDLAAIIKEKVGADHLRNLVAALLMAVVAWCCRREWPIVAIALGVGAVVVAFFGLGWAIGFAGFSLGGVVIYYAARAKLAPIV